MSPSQSEAFLIAILRGVTVVAGAIVLCILGFLALEALPILKKVHPIRFFIDPVWHPTEGAYGLMPMLIGSMLMTLGALLWSIPLGIASGVFSLFYAPRALAAAYERMIALLAGIPSVVYGLWGLVVLVPLIRKLHPPGPSLLAGMVILGFMVFPMIALSASASFSNIPDEYVQSAAALGLSRWETVRGVMLPAARPGLAAGILLAAGRAIGETMAVLMVSGNVVQLPRSVFDPVRTLTANIALEMAYAMDAHRAALFVCGLILMLAISVLVLTTERIRSHAAGH
ncbi:MAG: phosphate ABC transporter permease subunit PstC [Nitrospiria bacterium]